jgi:hypothetical protein
MNERIQLGALNNMGEEKSRTAAEKGYASSKMLGRQFSLPPAIALRPVSSLMEIRLIAEGRQTDNSACPATPSKPGIPHRTARLICRWTCPDSQLIRAKKTAIVLAAPKGVQSNDH